MSDQTTAFSRAKLGEVRKAIAERQADYEGYKEEMRKLRDQIHTLREQEQALEHVLAKFPAVEAQPVPVALPVEEGEEEQVWESSEALKSPK